MENALEHHGIKGQRWGVRRFQREDGSLTPLGKRMAGKKFSLASSGGHKSYKQKDDDDDESKNGLSVTRNSGNGSVMGGYGPRRLGAGGTYNVLRLGPGKKDDDDDYVTVEDNYDRKYKTDTSSSSTKKRTFVDAEAVKPDDGPKVTREDSKPKSEAGPKVKRDTQTDTKKVDLNLGKKKGDGADISKEKNDGKDTEAPKDSKQNNKNDKKPADNNQQSTDWTKNADQAAKTSKALADAYHNKLEEQRKHKPRMDLSDMTDDELQAAINREMKERKYNELFAPDNVTDGQKRMERILNTTASLISIGSTAISVANALGMLDKKR